MPRFRVEFVGELTDDVYVMVRQLDSDDFEVGPSATLGGVEIREWLTQPRALDEDGNQDPSLFGMVLRNAADRSKLRVGDELDLAR